MPVPYKRIPCQVYDHFEIAAMRQKMVKIRYQDAQGNEEQIETTIVTLKTKDKVEYAILKSGIEIRLDWILQLDDWVIQDESNCYL